MRRNKRCLAVLGSALARESLLGLAQALLARGSPGKFRCVEWLSSHLRERFLQLGELSVNLVLTRGHGSLLRRQIGS